MKCRLPFAPNLRPERRVNEKACEILMLLSDVTSAVSYFKNKAHKSLDIYLRSSHTILSRRLELYVFVNSS